MLPREPLTAEQFVMQRDDLPEGGRWVELIEGHIVRLEPPDEAHGTTVLNLSKAIADHLQRVGCPDSGYAGFDLGVVVARNPDTVRFPAISFFVGGERFAEVERSLTETRPALVVEIASTGMRRRNISERVADYHGCGIETVWVVDTVERETHVARIGGGVKRLAEHQSLSGSPVLSGFRVRVSDLFTEPAWWRS